MSVIFEFRNPDFWLILFIMISGALSNLFLSTEPIRLRNLAGDILRVVIVTITLWIYGVMEHMSPLQVIIIASLSAVVWPHAIDGFIKIIKRNISLFFDKK